MIDAAPIRIHGLTQFIFQTGLISIPEIIGTTNVYSAGSMMLWVELLISKGGWAFIRLGLGSELCANGAS